MNFYVSGKWSSWTKCASPWEVVAWTCGTKWWEVIIVMCYLEVLSYTLHCCYAVHGVCRYLPVLRTCKFKKWLCFISCISIIICQICRITGSHSSSLKISCHVVWYKLSVNLHLMLVLYSWKSQHRAKQHRMEHFFP